MTTRRANTVILILVISYVIYEFLFPRNPNNKFSDLVWNIAVNALGTILLYISLQFLTHINQLWFYIQTQFIYRNKEIRISLAYLFRIKVNDHYLLVKSNHRPYYQPVGGAYKTLPGSEKIFEKLDVRPDRIIETSNGVAKGDLRVFVKGVNVAEFMEWYKSKEDREISPWREFCEELVSKDLLPPHQFRFIDYKFKKAIKTPIIRLDSGYLGFFMFDIFDLVANDEQKAILKELYKKGNTEYHIWADEYIINRLGHDERNKKQEFEIAPHTKWALNLEYTKNKAL